MILECRNITKKFGELVALDSMSFEVQEGEIFGIAGPNGSGKTTLFNVISGFYRFTGEVKFKGKNISGLSAHEICKIGIARTFQTPQLFSTLTVWDNLRVGAHFGRKGKKNNDEKIEEVIKFVDLEGIEEVLAYNLKLLDKKKTMLAAALATSPEILMLDEPIAGLNPTETDQFMEIFKKINKELGTTIIIIEHLMRVLMELTNRMMIIQFGDKICCAPPNEVRKDKKAIECYLGKSNA